MKILWLDINASYGHASLALPAIHAQQREITDSKGCTIQTDWLVLSSTTQADPGWLAAEAVAGKPDLVLATLWLFTHEMVLKVLSRVKALHPSVKILLGGPEFLGTNEPFLRKHRYVDSVFRGEGEEAFWAWLPFWNRPSLWHAIIGFCFIDEQDRYHDGGTARVADFSALLPPEHSVFFDTDKPFVQVESARGCQNHCAFCVSGGDSPLRYVAMDILENRIASLRSKNIREIRLLDRTFNGDPDRACQLLRLFAEKFPDMRFHLEVHPARLTPDIRTLLQASPPDTLHIEAGVQSLQPEVIRACRRSGTVEATLEGLRFLAGNGHFETHADLIAGLPGYSFSALLSDIARLASLGVAEIQLELLKLLPGTRMRAEATSAGIRYAPDPPYEVLATDAISPDELQMARKLSRILDFFYNTAAFRNITIGLSGSYPGFFTDFLAFLNPMEVIDKPLSLEHRGRLLYAYCERFAPSFCYDVTVAWLKAGLSVQKEPGRKIEVWRGELPPGADKDPAVKWYRLTAGNRQLFVGYNRSRQMNVPLYLIEA